MIRHIGGLASFVALIGIISATACHSADTKYPVSPEVSSIDPAEGIQGDSLDVTIMGSGFQDGATSDFATSITVNSTTFVSDTELTANVVIDGAATVGARTVTLTNPDGEEGSLVDAFTVVAALQVQQITIDATSNVTNWTAEVDGVPVTPAGDNRVTITVEPGDEITWLVSGGSHGVAFESEAQMEALLDIDASEELSARPQSLLGQDLFGGNGFGTAQHGAGTELVRATVKDVATPLTLDFTCFVHGSSLMNGTLVLGQVEPPPPPTVGGVDPVEGQQGETLDVTISGTDFQDGADADFGAGITVNSTTFVSDTELTANVVIDGAATAGARTVTVTNPDGEEGSLADAFTVVPAPPVQQITIDGTSDVVNWSAEVDGVPVTPAGDNRVTITVEPGDEVTWLVSAALHGVVFQSEAQMEALLDIDQSQPLDLRSGFFGGNGFGTEGHGAGTELVRATVKDVATPLTLDFTCFIHGSSLMNGTLVLE